MEIKLFIGLNRVDQGGNMSTLLTTYIGNINASKPTYAGDLINNDALYTPVPDYDSDLFKRLSMNAKLFASVGSLMDADQKKAFPVAAMSTGWRAYEAALRMPNKVKQNAKAKFGEEFLTIQRLSDVVPTNTIRADILVPNSLKNQREAEIIGQNFEDYVINAPGDREGFLRAIHDIHSILQGAHYEDWVFEKYIWGPEVLTDTHEVIYVGDKSYSRCGATEQAVALAVQYGNKTALAARKNETMNVKDIYGREISQVDMAWEDCKQVVDVVERGFRTEASVALILTRFMYDDWYESGKGPIARSKVHHTVKKASDEDKARMKALKELILPYIAEKCDWSTLQPVLDNDPALRKFWDTKIAPLKGKMQPVKKIKDTLFSYYPRGGFKHPELYDLVKERRDPEDVKQNFNLEAKKSRMLGAHDPVFHPKWHAKRFEDFDFEYLGNTADPHDPVDNDRLYFTQAASIVVSNAVRKSRPQYKNHRTFLYVSSPISGADVADYINENGIEDYDEIYQLFDPSSDDETFEISHAIPTKQKNKARAKEILNDADWANAKQVGKVISMELMDDIAAQVHMHDEGLHADRTQAVGAEGPQYFTPAAKLTCAKRIVDHQVQGVIIPPGPLMDAKQYRIIIEALLVATGQVDRPYDGGKYDMEFYRDNGDGLPPQKIDLADLILLMGKTVEKLLDQPNPLPMRRHYVAMARILDIYEKAIDANVNVHSSMNAGTGKIEDETAINWNQVDPQLTAFLDDDPSKAKAVKDLWFRMRAQEFPEQCKAARGKLLLRGIHAFDNADLADLPDTYKKFKGTWNNNEAFWKKNIFQKNTIQVIGPQVSRP